MTDVVIVGGAATGAATAHHLAVADPSMSVTVIERDESLARSSTMLSDGNVRVQFDLEENVRISLYGMEVLETFGEDMEIDGIRPEVSTDRQGNLFLAPEQDRAAVQDAVRRQQGWGAEVRWMDIDEIARTWPAYRSDAVAGGSFGPLDGSVDPSTIVSAYKRRAVRAGVTFEAGEVAALGADRGRIRGVTMSDGTVRPADAVVVCAGAWSTELLATVGVDVPVEPVMRTVYVVRADVAEGGRIPSVFLPSGVYVIPEHDDSYLIGWSQPDDPVGFDFTPAPRSRFYDLIWPELVAYLPAFDRLEVVGSWAGLYAQNTMDANALIGEWPTIAGLYLATGFSGHGFQQCHGVGRYLAELLTDTTPAIDLSRFSPGRVLTGDAVYEHAGRII